MVHGFGADDGDLCGEDEHGRVAGNEFESKHVQLHNMKTLMKDFRA